MDSCPGTPFTRWGLLSHPAPVALSDDEIVAEIVKLETAMGVTVSSVQFADRSQTNLTSDELLARLSYLRGQQRLRTGRPRQTRIVAGKGF